MEMNISIFLKRTLSFMNLSMVVVVCLLLVLYLVVCCSNFDWT